LTNVRDQLRNQDLATVDASSFSTVGGRVFPDSAAVPDVRALTDIVNGWRAAHAVAYGAPIGGEDSTVSHNMQGDTIEAVYTPTGKQVARIIGVQVSNGGGAPMTADLYAGGVLLGVQQINVNPSEASGFLLQSDIYVGPSTPLQIKIASGTPSDATAKVAFVLCGV
jgi:hypothetical protein